MSFYFLENSVANAFDDYQKTATKSFFMDLMNLFEEHKLIGVSLQYSNHNARSFGLVKGSALLSEVYDNEEFDIALMKMEISYKEHLTHIMHYVINVQKLRGGNYEFSFDILDFSNSALKFCGEALLEEIEAVKLNQSIETNKKAKTLKV